jgi:hypothetical protein
MNSIRHSAEHAAWPLRPWIWALLCSLGAFAVNQLVKSGEAAIWRQIAATFVIVATLGFVLTAEHRRLAWAIGFAVGAASVLAFVGWFTAAYNKGGEIAQYPFLAGIFALLIAAPLFQTVRDEGAWRFPYARLHSHVWTDAVIGAASLAFTGVAFLLAFLIAQLFDLIGIKLFTDLLGNDWFGAILAGFAFGGALGLLRERDALVATLQKLVLVIFAVLSPVLALALTGFLFSLPFTGLAPLWDSGVPTSPVLLMAAAGAVGLINAVIGDGKADGSQNVVLRWSAVALSCSIAPLAVIAAISMAARVQQYGFTPDRIWGLLAVLVAAVYGTAYLAAVMRAALGRAVLDWDAYIRPANIQIALGVCGLALFLALPILDFGAMSARDQLARLKASPAESQKFDWRAMAFDFGPKGRSILADLSKNGTPDQQKAAKAALLSESRWDIDQQVEIEQNEALAGNFTYQPATRTLDADGRRTLLMDGQCQQPCRIMWLSDTRLLVVGSSYKAAPTEATIYVLEKNRDARGRAQAGIIWQREVTGNWQEMNKAPKVTPQSEVELRPVDMQQAFIDGVPVGNPFKK